MLPLHVAYYFVLVGLGNNSEICGVFWTDIKHLACELVLISEPMVFCCAEGRLVSQILMRFLITILLNLL